VPNERNQYLILLFKFTSRITTLQCKYDIGCIQSGDSNNIGRV